jgi:hypothetical protein
MNGGRALCATPLHDLAYACKIHDNLNMATLTKTLKLPFLRLNKAKAQEFARLECLNTEVANQILAMPKAERRELTTRSFSHVEIGSGWINQTILDILPCLKAGDSCSWFCERTYFFRLPL